MTTGTTSKKASWVNGIDSLRFFLALIVFLSHTPKPYITSLIATDIPALKVLAMALRPLFSGVSAVIAFFIISGFVIHYPNKNAQLDATRFLIRRWVRIGIPLLVIGYVAYLYDSFVLLPVWSLYCELIYYTLYPLLRKLKLSWFRQFAIAFILSYAILIVLTPETFTSLIHQKEVIGSKDQYWSLGPGLTWLIGLPCWLLGVVLAEQFDNLSNAPSKTRIWAFRLLVLGMSMMINVLKFKFFASFIITENIFSIVLFFWLRDEFVYYKFNKSSPFFEQLGKFSYSLYLGHPLLFIWLGMVLPFNTYTYLLYVVIVVAISYVLYLLVEYPSHRLAQMLTRKKKVVASAATPE